MTTRAGLSRLFLLAILASLFPPVGRQAGASGFIYIPLPGPIEIPRLHPWPRPQPRPHFPLQVTKHRVSVRIEDTLASTRVDETFYNPNDSQLEGVYIFPLPDGAAVGSFRMMAGGKEVAGEVLEKDRARQIYEDIVRQARDPGLLEYMDRGLFKARVFPIPPRAGVDISLEYSESLKRENGQTRFIYPLNTGKHSSGDLQNVSIDLSVRSAAPIRSVQCPSHDAGISRNGDKELRVGFEARTLRADRDFVLEWSVGEDLLAPVLVTHRGHEPDGFFYLSIAPRSDRQRNPQPKDVIFVIDTSGSMSGVKIEQVRKTLRYCVGALSPNDRFNIIDFSTEARSFRPSLVPADALTRPQAEAYIEGLVARGGTNIEEALRLAMASGDDPTRLKIVVFLTDGEPTVGVTQPADLLRSVRERNQDRRRIFVFGVGEDLNAKLLDSLVRENRGASQYIRGDENLEVPISSFFDKIDSPVLTDLAIRFRGEDVSQIYPKPLPDLFRGEQLDLFGRYRSGGFKTVVIEGRYLGEHRVFEYSLDFKDARNDHLPRLWALRAIGHLLEEIRLRGESAELKDEIVRLSKLYGVITPYTSYLILEEDRVARAPGLGGQRFGYAASDALLSRSRLGDAGGPETFAAPELAERVQDEAAAGARAFQAESGGRAVELSRELRALKAGRLAPLERGAEADRREGVRWVLAGDRVFYLQDDRWIDSTLTARALSSDSPVRQVKYLSPEYFALLADGSAIGSFLAVGPRVTFLWKGEVISIID